METKNTYNGWKNRQTWNVALWIGNDYGIYMAAMPDVPLSKKQKEIVTDLYYRFITKRIDHQRMGLELYKTETREKWPSGPRVKEHEAKRFILEQLVELNSPRRIEMNASEAADFFFSALNWRSYNQEIIKYAYRQ
jgi:hypothetical protein